MIWTSAPQILCLTPDFTGNDEFVLCPPLIIAGLLSPSIAIKHHHGPLVAADSFV